MKTKKTILIILMFAILSCYNNNNINNNNNNNNQENIKNNVGIFSSDSKKDQDNIIIRFSQNDKIISRYDFINLLKEKDFKTLINNTIANLKQDKNKNGYQLKMPIINSITKDEAFYILAIASDFTNTTSNTYYDYFFNCNELSLANKTQPKYKEHFISFIGDNLEKIDINSLKKLNNGAVAFRGGYNNAEKEKVMVSPCPFLKQEDQQYLTHIYAYAKKLNSDNLEQRIQNFWQIISDVANQMFDGKNLKDNYGKDSNEK